MADLLIGIIIGSLILSPAMLARVPENPINLYKKLEECEADLPRNQYCELVAVVKDKE